MQKKYLMAGCLVSAGLLCTAEARFHIVYDPFFDAPWVDHMLDFHERAVEGLKSHLESFGSLKEEREVLKSAREQMSKIKYEVKEEGNGFKILFTGFEGLDKKDVKVVKEDGGWAGSITLKQGRLEFFLSSRGLQVNKRIELRQETKPDAKNSDAKNKEAKAEERVIYSSSSATQDYFKTVVDLSTLKALPVKPTEFVLTVSKKKETVLELE